MIKTLKVNDISKTIKNRPIVQGVSLALNQKEIVGILGPNGSGKTTLFSLIIGLIYPDRGTIFINDLELTHLPMYKRARLGLGYLPQEHSIFRGLTVEENILAALEMRIKSRLEQEDALQKLLDEFSLGHLRDSPSIALSGGERRRVEIARSLALSPQFILLDEPLAGIDPIAVSEIKELILNLKQLGIGILITDHNVRETFEIVDHAYILVSGKILAHGDPQTIAANPDVRRIYLGERFSL